VRPALGSAPPGGSPIDDERLRRVLHAVSAGDGSPPALCGVCAVTLRVGGAAVTVVADGGPPATLCASNPLAGRIEELQYVMGEGPGVDAHLAGTSVSEPDLDAPRRLRWPLFTRSAVAAGAGALFAFPLRAGAVRLGALTLHQAHAGGLSDAQHADALTLADVVMQVVVARQAGAHPGALAEALEPLATGRAEIHQAAGMISVQLSVSVTEALVRLRARAFRDGRPLADLAADVVARRTRFGP
jgi:hypothetical protein